MRIEIHSGGGSSVLALENGLSSLHTNISSTIESLQKVAHSLNNVTGGAGNLSPAVESIQKRMNQEHTKLAKIERFSNRVTQFINNAVNTDMQVARSVIVNQEKFFNEYSWLRPPVPVEEPKRHWWDNLRDGWNKFWGDAGEALNKAWNGIKNFVKEHAVELIVGTVAIVVGAAIVALTGGAAAAFVPALLAGLKVAAVSAATSGVISAVIAGFKGENVLQAFGDGLASGYMWGGIFAGASSAMAGIMRISAKCGVTQKVFGRIKLWSPNSLDNPNIGGTLLKIGRTFRIDFEAGTKFVQVGQKFIAKSQFLHFHIPTSTFERLPTIIKGAKWIFEPARRDVHVRLIPIIAPVVSNLFK